MVIFSSLTSIPHQAFFIYPQLPPRYMLFHTLGPQHHHQLLPSTFLCINHLPLPNSRLLEIKTNTFNFGAHHPFDEMPPSHPNPNASLPTTDLSNHQPLIP
uniref:Uncharacterized protein n=1 Tax=Opuntia streptacantha TaxID=393608 RepID=A0A7C9E3E5_OPUST